MKIIKIMSVLFFVSCLSAMEHYSDNYSDQDILSLFSTLDQDLVAQIIATQLDDTDISMSEFFTSSADVDSGLQNFGENKSKKRQYDCAFLPNCASLPTRRAESLESYTCSLCCPPKIFSSKSSFSYDFRKHLCKKHALSTYSCSEENCSDYFETKHEMIDHRKEKHSEYPCSKCPLSFDAYTKRASHYCRKHGNPLYACKYMGCKKEFVREYLLFEHLASEHYDIDLIAPESLVEYVQKKRAREPNQIYTCLCSFSTSKIGNLRKHVLTKHNILPYPCVNSDCDRRFSSQEDLNRHKGEPHVYTCGQCNTSHVNDRAYRKHYSLKHNNLLHQCKFCGKAFSREKQLLLHELEAHFNILRLENK